MQDKNFQNLSYTKTHRAVETAGLICYFSLMLYSLKVILKIAELESELPWLFLFLFAAMLADFVAGMVHWGADTWGTETTPFFGSWLIRSFREHHVDPKAITRHDFVETNGAVAVGLSPLLFAFIIYLPASPSRFQAIAFVLFILFSFWILFTNQIHKWSHQQTQPLFVRILQKIGLALSPTHHQGHHTAPFDKRYCITNGWMNPILDKIGYFRFLERTIHTLTGEIPRDYETPPISNSAP